MTPRDPRTILRAHGLWTKKHFGQNFLVAPGVPDRIAAAGGARKADTVFEIGAGVGTLTHALAARAGRVIALERDRELMPVLESEFAGCENVTLREGNVLDVNWAAEAEANGGPLVIYGNLPYHLSTQIVLGLLAAPMTWTRACFLLQREFAARLAAPPGDRGTSALSAQAALWAISTLAFEVGPGSFHPPPKVHSAVLVMERRAAPAVDVGDAKAYRAVVRALFAQRRKMARRALRSVCDDPVALLESAGVTPTARGEALSIEELAALSRALVALRAS